MKSTVALIAVGDVFLSGSAASATEELGLYPLFDDVSSTLRAADLRFCNIEGPISAKGVPLKKCCLSSAVMLAESLGLAGFNIVSLANNHIFDYGLPAFEETLSLLTAKGIECVGAGQNIDLAVAPSIFKINGITVAFLAFSWDLIESQYAAKFKPGVAPLKQRVILHIVTKLRQDADVLVVSLHWGYERERYPLPYQRKMAHRIIEAGADLILGHHPHVLQGIEEYRKGIIVYSLGNFVFPDYTYKHYVLEQREENKRTFAIRVTFAKNGYIDYNIIPVKMNAQYQPTLVLGQEAISILSEVQQLSQPFAYKNYRQFWKINRVRKDLPELKRASKVTLAKIRLHRFLIRLRNASLAKRTVNDQ